jgi:hypothetical protein
MFVRRFMIFAAALLALGIAPLDATVSNFSVTPSSVTFTSGNPAGIATGSPATSTVLFQTHGGPSSFTIRVKATTPNFTGCNAPPASAVTVSCSGASAITCSGAAPLSNVGNGTTVGIGTGSQTGSLVITYTFQDSWKYQQGASCSIITQIIYTEP